MSKKSEISKKFTLLHFEKFTLLHFYTFTL